jgi:S-DNA-T family DNA segregation ATPase FtsK/SpoIIIE
VPLTDVIRSRTHGRTPGHTHGDALDDTLDVSAWTPSRRPAVPVGVGGDELDIVGLDPHRDGPLWLVAGSTRSGKSTALRTLGEGLARLGHPLAIVSTRPGPLDGLRDRSAMSVWAGADDTDALVAARRTNPDLAVLVDDADQLLDTPVEPVLRELARAARQGHGLLACSAGTGSLLTQYRGVAVEVARSQVGLLLSPRGSSDGELFGLGAGRGHAGAGSDRVPGRGLLVTADGPVDVQVAVAETEVRSREDSRFARSA